MNILEQIELEVKNNQITEYSEIEAKLKELEATYGTEVPDASNKAGYLRAKEISGSMTKIRTALEAKRKAFKAPVLSFGKLIDSEANSITARILAIEEPFKNAYREVDNEKKRIKAEIEQRIADIKDAPNKALEMSTSTQIENLIDDLASIDLSKDLFGAKVEEAASWLTSTLERLNSIHANKVMQEQEAIRREAEQAELEALRREKEEREAKERQAEESKRQEEERQRIAEHAREQERQRQKGEAERAEREKQEAIQAAEAAEAARIAAEKQAKIDAEAAAERARQQEIERQEAELKRQQEEIAAREANRAHTVNIQRQAKESLMALGIDEDKAKQIVLAICKCRISNVTINY